MTFFSINLLKIMIPDCPISVDLRFLTYKILKFLPAALCIAYRVSDIFWGRHILGALDIFGANIEIFRSFLCYF